MAPLPGPVPPGDARDDRDGRPPRDGGGSTRPLLPPEAERAGAGREGERTPGHPRRLGLGPEPASGPTETSETGSGSVPLRLHPCRAIRVLGVGRGIHPLDLAGRLEIPNVLHLRGIGQGDRHVVAAAVVSRGRACGGRTGRAGRRDRAMGCAVARKFPHRRTDTGVPDTLPCASPARGAPAGRRRDTAGPGRAPRGPIPAGQSARSRRFRKSPPYRALRSDRLESRRRTDRRGRRTVTPRKPLVSLFDGVSPRSTVGRWPPEEPGDRATPGWPPARGRNLLHCSDVETRIGWSEEMTSGNLPHESPGMLTRPIFTHLDPPLTHLSSDTVSIRGAGAKARARPPRAGPSACVPGFDAG